MTQDIEKLQIQVKKLKKRLKIVMKSLQEQEEFNVENKKKIEALDTRTLRMGAAIRECMKELDIDRSEIS